jgi:uncharacterized membrane protein YjgN (DUF898 family)
MVTSQALADLLDGNGVPPLLGSRSSGYFSWILVIDIIVLMLGILCWLLTSERNSFPVDKVNFPGRRVAYRLRLSGLISFPAFMNLVVGNTLGVLAVFLYVMYAYANFVQVPSWLN